MLTPGEFVVNADASRKHLDILKAINKSKGGRIGKPQYLQNGGRAGGEGIVGDLIDVVQMESESQAANIAVDIGASLATGAIPFAGAVKTLLALRLMYMKVNGLMLLLMLLVLVMLLQMSFKRLVMRL